MDGCVDTAISKEIGRGRSAVVYRCHDTSGRDIASKVFVGDPAGKLVNYLFFGAPNAYIWNEDAMQCALLRRKIVCELVKFWFGSKLSVADGYTVGWNNETRSFSMDTRFVEGRPASLHHPFSAPRDREYMDLRRLVMRPLQRRLEESGLDGLVWQAGRGNPVAVNNFLCNENHSEEYCWTWIDLESGVPAIAPINPIDLLFFYLPKSWRHRRPLFDDVDIEKLRLYIRSHEEAIRLSIGNEQLATLEQHVDELESFQNKWRSKPRLLRSIHYRLGKGEITREQADWYGQRPVRWYGRETRRALAAGATYLIRLFAVLGRYLLHFNYAGLLRGIWMFFASQRFRSDLAHAYVKARIARWTERGQLARSEARYLIEALDRDSAGSFITDFGIHVSTKPAIKLFQWVVLPFLFAAKMVGPAAMTIMIVFGGMIIRTLYTMGRAIQAAIVGHRLPWVALVVGLLPVVGNAAYPMQIIYQSAGHEGKLAAFILYDTLTVIGEQIPIWGGRDTATEHLFNHMVDLIVRKRCSLEGTPENQEFAGQITCTLP